VRADEHAPPWDQADVSITGIENRIAQLGRRRLN
jgi:hypothetical protein